VESNCTTITLSETKVFPKLLLDFLDKKDSLNDFYNEFPDQKGFDQLISTKKFTDSNRQILVNSLKSQYENSNITPDLDILLDSKTFTVTTGHQLNIFTGPLYIIYKIVSTINLAKKLKSFFPEYNFVPVYWMATEDHDFEEISSFSLFGAKHQWTTEQKGAVGKMNPSELKSIIESIKDLPDFFKEAYLNSKTLTESVRKYIHSIFSGTDLICIDGDDKELKAIFKPQMIDDILSQTNKELVDKNTQNLEDLGYKTQISAREINFFYLQDGFRERIVEENGTWKVLNSDISWSEADLLSHIESNPECFSPNVVLRPLYQEIILPNLAYIGGPSELPYWLQLKGIFDKNKIDFPCLVPRNFALVLNQSNSKKLSKLNVKASDLFKEDTVLKRDYVTANSENSLSLDSEISKLIAVFKEIESKTILVEPTLKAAAEAEQTKAIKSIENFEKRLKKAEEQKFETSINQLLGIKEKLFPAGGLQERKENFMNFYLNDKNFIPKLYQLFDPLDFKFMIIEV
jgi:bacillithiol synthase